MRGLLLIVLLLLAGWTGVWFFGANRIEDEVANAFAAQERSGHRVSHSGIEVEGYPYRFDLRVEEPALASRNGRVAWSAPDLRVFALAYRPNHLIVHWPAEQRLTIDGVAHDIRSTGMEASAIVGLATQMPLERTAFAAADMSVVGENGWSLDIGEAHLATRTAEDGTPDAHDVVLTLSRLAPQGALQQRLDPAGRMPDLIEELKLEGRATFDRPIDRQTLEGQTPRLMALKLSNTGFGWGGADIRLAGDLSFDSAGLGNGTLTVSVSGWRQVLDLAISAGVVPDNRRATLERALELVEKANLSARSLQIPLAVRQGTISLGPIPVAALPPIPR